MCFQEMVVPAEADEVFFAGASFREWDGVVFVAASGVVAAAGPAAGDITGFDVVIKPCGCSVAFGVEVERYPGCGVGEHLAHGGVFGESSGHVGGNRPVSGQVPGLVVEAE